MTKKKDTKPSKADELMEQEQARVDEVKAASPELPGVGHNSGEDNVGGRRLKSVIERIERMEEEKKGLVDDIKEIYAEARGTGFAPKIIRKIVNLRKMDIEKRREEDELLETYKSAIGMV